MNDKEIIAHWETEAFGSEMCLVSRQSLTEMLQEARRDERLRTQIIEMEENCGWKLRWEALKKELKGAEKIMKPMRIEISRVYLGILLKMHELESGGHEKINKKVTIAGRESRIMCTESGGEVHATSKREGGIIFPNGSNPSGIGTPKPGIEATSK